MEKAYFTEVELALRWDLSPKTLQRWRTDGRGPHFLKFSKCVRYPIDEIMVFENKSMRDSTSSRPNDIYTTYGDDLLTIKQIAQATGLPLYIFANMKIREGLKVPHTKLQNLIRFSFAEVRNWAFALCDGSERIATLLSANKGVCAAWELHQSALRWCCPELMSCGFWGIEPKFTTTALNPHAPAVRGA